MSKMTNRKTYSVTLAFLLATLCTAATGKLIYVDHDAKGVNDGYSWENAYVYLQEALAKAKISEKPVEIRVAQGVYKPNEGLFAIPEFDWLLSKAAMPVLMNQILMQEILSFMRQFLAEI
jgi:hypothetical protein